MNLSSSLKKFVSNKNTITIIGVVLCIIILYWGYNFRINQKFLYQRFLMLIKRFNLELKLLQI